jgi:hypothetical protein
MQEVISGKVISPSYAARLLQVAGERLEKVISRFTCLGLDPSTGA